jgi:hypothetical protein
VQGSVAKVGGFVDIDNSPNEGLGSREVAPSHNAIECIVAVTAGRIHIRKISVGKSVVPCNRANIRSSWLLMTAMYAVS